MSHDHSPVAEEIAEAIRRHLHDMRNHLNGVEMEAVLLDSAVSDEVSRDAVKRIHDEVELMEGGLKSLGTRFAAPDRQVVSAMDVFNLWRSRAGTDSPDSWKCEVDGELIEVDMRVTADALCELVTGAADQTIENSASTSGGGVLFLVRTRGKSEKQTPHTKSQLPGLESVFSRNGGRYQQLIDETTGEQISQCWFPCAGG